MSDQTIPAQIPGVDDAVNQLLGAVQSNIGRIVALFIPIITAVVTAGAFWLQNVIGIDVQHYVGGAVAFIVLIGTSVLASGITWLRNRGKHEVVVAENVVTLAAAQQEVQAQLLAGGGVPVELHPDDADEAKLLADRDRSSEAAPPVVS